MHRYAWVLWLLVATTSMPLRAQEHFHVAAKVSVERGETSGAGDALGLYAIRFIACAPDARAADHTNWRHRAGEFAERLVELLVSTAHANHRESFEGDASREVKQRIALDTSAVTPIGELVVPAGRYCRVGLVLARLPAIGAQPALAFSLRLSDGAQRSVTLDYRENVEIALTQPWVPSGKTPTLTVVLRPARALPLLAVVNLEDGERTQRAVAALAASATATVK
jgi:hypothetical protein